MDRPSASVDSHAAVIEVTDLVKEYRGGDGSLIRAVDRLSLSVNAGEIVGLLGANGAGKTTTLRIIATLLRPTAGTARVCGHDSLADPVGVRRSLGYVSATTGVPDRLTARELLSSFGRLNGLSEAEVDELHVAEDSAADHAAAPPPEPPPPPSSSSSWTNSSVSKAKPPPYSPYMASP